jgi:hypothetical protein
VRDVYLMLVSLGFGWPVDGCKGDLRPGCILMRRCKPWIEYLLYEIFTCEGQKE